MFEGKRNDSIHHQTCHLISVTGVFFGFFKEFYCLRQFKKGITDNLRISFMKVIATNQVSIQVKMNMDSSIEQKCLIQLIT